MKRRTLFYFLRMLTPETGRKIVPEGERLSYWKFTMYEEEFIHDTTPSILFVEF